MYSRYNFFKSTLLEQNKITSLNAATWDLIEFRDESPINQLKVNKKDFSS